LSCEVKKHYWWSLIDYTLSLLVYLIMLSKLKSSSGGAKVKHEVFQSQQTVSGLRIKPGT
jgi:hypothetical protein